jgi:hypothetical protein
MIHVSPRYNGKHKYVFIRIYELRYSLSEIQPEDAIFVKRIPHLKLQLMEERDYCLADGQQQ